MKIPTDKFVKQTMKTPTFEETVAHLVEVMIEATQIPREVLFPYEVIDSKHIDAVIGKVKTGRTPCDGPNISALPSRSTVAMAVQNYKPCPDCKNSPGFYEGLLEKSICKTCNGLKEVPEEAACTFGEPGPWTEITMTAGQVTGSYVAPKSEIRLVGGHPRFLLGSSIRIINADVGHSFGYDSHEEFREAVCPIDVQVPMGNGLGKLFAIDLLHLLCGKAPKEWPDEFRHSTTKQLSKIFRQRGDIL